MSERCAGTATGSFGYQRVLASLSTRYRNVFLDLESRGSRPPRL